MSVDTAGPAAAPTPAVSGSPNARRQALLVIAVVLGVFALVAGAYALGSRTNRHTTLVLNGTAHVGDHVASIRVGTSFDYGISGTVRWFDAQGTEHDDSWPACLSTPGRDVPIRFGAVTVELPDGGRVRDVVWVDCR